MTKPPYPPILKVPPSFAKMMSSPPVTNTLRVMEDYFRDRLVAERSSAPPAAAKPITPTREPKRRSKKTEAHLAAIRHVWKPGMTVPLIMQAIRAIDPTAAVAGLEPRQQSYLCAIVRDEQEAAAPLKTPKPPF